jgi:hypothetical protein
MVRTRATDTSPVALIPEIERTLSSLRKTRRALFLEEGADVTREFVNRYGIPNFNQSIGVDETMAESTLDKLIAPDMEQPTRAITFPALPEGQSFELKTGVVNLLPKFSGSALEDPIKHLEEFTEMCTSLKPSNLTDVQMMLRVFVFSLKDAARDWYHTLPAKSIADWAAMKKVFLEKYFPITKSSQIKKQITNIEQGFDESLYDYCERFNRLVKSCPYHNIANHDLILSLFNGLKKEDRRHVNSSCGGSILQKTYTEAIAIFATLAEDSRACSDRSAADRLPVRAAGVENDDLAVIKEELKRVKLKLTNQQVKACELCLDEFHPTDACPTLQVEEVNAIGGFQGQQRNRYEGGYNNNNQQWNRNNHPNFSWSNPNNALNPPAPSQFAQRPPAPSQSQQPSIEDLMQAMVKSNAAVNETMSKLGQAQLQMTQVHKTTT